ncbi:lipopolysaccharide biosynthesis protein [Chloroflexus sp.]|uniref:tyrosine-protein kinase domain-containing protein n=1 Tax=Chloroflexus sp. TaxID=1904827 RepID=UPI00298EFCF9|nr:lipopolysaccharide biosynthesis protein [Chloroflexus sp.]MCS6887023.1 lipopolysaccharide biosynthesis protein [Chloroflexus sp.]MDW8403097.1 lipopolysaccharide biosynthesis protein [Chloroflexus sp.]
MLTWSDIWSYMRTMLRWWWVALLAALLAASAALIFALRQPDYYVSRVTLRVGDTLSTAAPDPQMIGLSNTVAGFYGEMAKRAVILEPVAEKLGLPFPWPVIRDYMLATSVNRQASLLEITITDTNPQRAAAIAGAIATELIQFGPNSPENIAAQRNLLNEQIARAQREIEQLDRQIDQTRELLAQATSATDLREARNRLQELEQARDTAQNAYTQLLRLQNTSMVNSLSLFEAAKVPEAPLPNKRRLTVAVAGLAGLLLGLMASFVLEAIDTRWRNHNDLRSRFGLNFLGTVPGKRPLIGLREEEARMRASAVKEAHTQIVLAGLPRNARILMISGPRPSHERSALVIDLAHCYTLSGYRVLLVDAETERAALSELFGDPEPVLQPIMIDGETQVWSSLRVTPMKNVLLLARNIGEDGRPLPPSQPWPVLVEGLQRAADILIFDGPSTLTGVEAALLAPIVDGVVLALKPTEDSSRDIQQSLKRLTLKRNDSVLGAVMLTEEYTLPTRADRLRLPLPNLRRLLGDMPLQLLNPGKGQSEAEQSGRQTVNGTHGETTGSLEGEEGFVRTKPVAGRVIVTPPAPESKTVIVLPSTPEHHGVREGDHDLGESIDEMAERAVGEPIRPSLPQQAGEQAGNKPNATKPSVRRRPITSRRRRT